MERPKVGVGVFVMKDGKFLIGKRKGALASGSWGLPGGHLEFGESLEECSRREVLEETGVSIKNIKRATFTNDIFAQENKHYITIFMIAEYDFGDVQTCEPEKCEGWQWCSWGEIPKELCMLGIRNLMEQGFVVQSYF
jgi:8-oxo-dGTP diphosphatase